MEQIKILETLLEDLKRAELEMQILVDDPGFRSRKLSIVLTQFQITKAILIDHINDLKNEENKNGK